MKKKLLNQQNIRLSSPSRILHNFLVGLNNVDNLDINEAYLLEKICYNYYPNPMINMITSKLKGRKVETKHTTISYWIPLLKNTFANNVGAKRPTYKEITNHDGPMQLKFQLINQMLLNDYTITDLSKMIDMMENCTYSEIKVAVKACKKSGIMNISYLQAIANNEHGKNQYRLNQIDNIKKKTEASTKRLEQSTVVNNTLTDIASVHCSWEEALQNRELEKQLENLRGT